MRALTHRRAASSTAVDMDNVLGKPAAKGNSPPKDRTDKNPSSTARLQFLDVSRGITLALMLFVNHADQRTPWWVGHAAWDGLHLADFVMPAFLLINGMTIGLSLAPLVDKGASKRALLSKVLARVAKLFALGLLIQGSTATGRFPAWDLARLRLMGILQRIALCFGITACTVILLPRLPATQLLQRLRLHQLGGWIGSVGRVALGYPAWWLLAGGVAAGFAALPLLAGIPGCAARPPLAPNCNWAAYFDEKVLGLEHMYPWATCRFSKPPCAAFDPEGLYTTLGGALPTSFIGLFLGLQPASSGASPMERPADSVGTRFWGMAVPSLAAGAGGLALHAALIPLNKNLYSASYVLVTSGAAGLLLSAVYLAVDGLQVQWCRWLGQPFRWLGLNSIVVFVGDEVLEKALTWVYFGDPQNNAESWLHHLFQSAFGKGWVATDAFAAADVLFWVIIAGLLYRNRCFFKV